MSGLTSSEQLIYNSGERLIPGLTHDIDELVRHRSSYRFFHKVIADDVQRGNQASERINIVDLGCGVGHGCSTLASLPRAHVLGIDVSQTSLDYARSHYAAANISYQQGDLPEYIAAMPTFDYVVSRNVFEHLPSGLELAGQTQWSRRLMFDVPYDEAAGNPHHQVHYIREEQLRCFPNAELFFQDLSGVIYREDQKPRDANVIACVCSHPSLPKVRDMVSFPFAAWSPPLASGSRQLAARVAVVCVQMPSRLLGPRVPLAALLRTCHADSFRLLTAAPRVAVAAESEDQSLATEMYLLETVQLKGLRDATESKASRLCPGPVRYLLQVRELARQIQHVAEREACEVLLVVGDSIFDIPAASLAARRMKIPYLVYLPDDQVLQYSCRSGFRSVGWLHDRGLKQASQVIVGDPSIGQDFERRFGVAPMVATCNAAASSPVVKEAFCDEFADLIERLTLRHAPGARRNASSIRSTSART